MSDRQMSAVPLHPALARHAEMRRGSLQDRIADLITRFSGSMWFVYIHVAWFTVWIALRVESYPFGLLTMIVSLEAIFLSTFVLISQNRADERRQMLADQEWRTVMLEEKENQELIRLSNQILELTREIREWTSRGGPGSV